MDQNGWWFDSAFLQSGGQAGIAEDIRNPPLDDLFQELNHQFDNSSGLTGWSSTRTEDNFCGFPYFDNGMGTSRNSSTVDSWTRDVDQGRTDQPAGVWWLQNEWRSNPSYEGCMSRSPSEGLMIFDSLGLLPSAYSLNHPRNEVRFQANPSTHERLTFLDDRSIESSSYLESLGEMLDLDEIERAFDEVGGAENMGNATRQTLFPDSFAIPAAHSQHAATPSIEVDKPSEDAPENLEEQPLHRLGQTAEIKEEEEDLIILSQAERKSSPLYRYSSGWPLPKSARDLLASPHRCYAAPRPDNVGLIRVLLDGQIITRADTKNHGKRKYKCRYTPSGLHPPGISRESERAAACESWGKALVAADVIRHLGVHATEERRLLGGGLITSQQATIYNIFINNAALNETIDTDFCTCRLCPVDKVFVRKDSYVRHFKKFHKAPDKLLREIDAAVRGNQRYQQLQDESQ